MNNFDFSLYDPEDVVQPKKQVNPEKKTSAFDFELYDDTPIKKENPDKIYNKYYKAPDYSKEELKGMSPEERYQYAQELNVDKEYRQSTGFIKNALSQLSFGFSERADALKPNEEDLYQGLGTIAGAALPQGLGFKLLGMGINMIPKAYKWSKNLLHVLGSASIGGGNEAIRQVGKGEEFDPLSIGLSALEYGGTDAVLRSIVGGYKWLKQLTKPQQEQFLTKNMIPENMTPAEYEFYEKNVQPILQQKGQQQYEEAYKNSLQENDMLFKQEMANVRGKHENDLYKIGQLEEQHTARVKEIEEANDFVMKQFEKSTQEWEATKARENIVRESLESANQKSETNRKINVTEGEDVGIRPSPIHAESQSLKNRVGNIVSKNSFNNPTQGGEEVTAAIRASSKADQRYVAKLYENSDTLNKGVESTHPETAQEIRMLIEHLNSKGNLTPAEQQMLSNANTTLERLIQFDEQGNAIGFETVDNQFLLDQAKQLRQKMYYDYGESNSTGIFNPLIDIYHDAAREAAVNTGNMAAVEANDVARAAHREWASLYKNRQIRQWRNLTSNKPTSLYENGLNIDNYRQVDRVLSRTNTGQNLSSQMRRDLINKKLSKFYKDPRAHSLEEFNSALDNLEPILQPGERSRISHEFNMDRRSNFKQAKKISRIEEPKEPKLEKIPENKKSQPSYVNIPTKKPVPNTPAMKEASKLMNISNEEIIKMSKSPTGLRSLKEHLSSNQRDKQIFEELKKEITGKILHKNSYKGKELYDSVVKNFDVISELYGKQHTNELMNAAEKIGDNRVTREQIIKITKNISLVKIFQSLNFL